MKFSTPFLFAFLLLSGSNLFAEEPSPEKIFTDRIMPIFSSPNPSSCVQCHLSGVDLKNYILPSHEKTFLSLRDQGLVDLDKPERSKILELINRGSQEKGAPMIQTMNRQAELAAFSAWIKACCADPKLRAAEKLDKKELAEPVRPIEVIRHNRKDRILDSFERNIWALRFRCMNCHVEGTPQNDKFRKEFGEQVAWIKKAGPAATLDYLLSSKLIDSKDPTQSLLLLKPLNDVKHQGGKKFVIGDQGYKSFRAWIEDLASVRSNKYRKASDLPAQETGFKKFGADIWLKLVETPPAWGDKLLEVRIFAWDANQEKWESEPVATSDRVVWGKGRQWQHNLTLMATAGSDRAKRWTDNKPTLAAGKFLVKVYVDKEGKAAKDWTKPLDEAEYVGKVEIASAWPEGYGTMTQVKCDRVK